MNSFSGYYPMICFRPVEPWSWELYAPYPPMMWDPRINDPLERRRAEGEDVNHSGNTWEQRCSRYVPFFYPSFLRGFFLPMAYMYNTVSETVDTGGNFKVSVAHMTGGFEGCGEGIIVRYPGLYRIDIQATAVLAGTYTIQVCLDGTPVTEGAISCTCGNQLGGFLVLRITDTPKVVTLRNSGTPMTTLPGTSTPAIAAIITGYDIFPYGYGEACAPYGPVRF